jgi:hypothetical protein
MEHWYHDERHEWRARARRTRRMRVVDSPTTADGLTKAFACHPQPAVHPFGPLSSSVNPMRLTCGAFERTFSRLEAPTAPPWEAVSMFQSVRSGRRASIIPTLSALLFMSSLCAAFLAPEAAMAQLDTPVASPKIGAEAMRQIRALEAEKASRTPAQRKIDSQLLYAIKMRRGQPIAEGVTTLEVNVGADAAGRVEVDLSANVTAELLDTLRGMGIDTSYVFPQYHTLRARLSLDQLEAVASLPQVRFIQPKQGWMNHRAPARPAELPATPGALGETARAERVRAALAGIGIGVQQPNAIPNGYAQVGAASAEAVITHGVYSARGTFNTDGTGIRIGVLSNGVNSMASSQASNDLPPTCSSLAPPATEHCVNVVPGQAGTGDEGTAMLEIVHDVAPGAQLVYATALSTVAQFAANITTLRNTFNCDIIVDDVGYFVESSFQDGQGPLVISTTNGGLITQAVNDVVASGALYFSSAANSGNLTDGTAGTWEGDFVPGGTIALVSGTDQVHDFDPTAAVAQSNLLIVGTGTAPMSLSWSDPLGGSANDYDLYVLNATLTTIITSSTNVQSGTQDPYEQTTVTVAANRRAVILQKAGAANRFMHLDTNRGVLTIATNGNTHGHNAASGAYGVAATPVFMPNNFPAAGPVFFHGPYPNLHGATDKTQTFSSDGPRRIFFQGDGTAITPGNFSSTGGSVLQQPLITAGDGNAITGAGGFPNPFYGTSCSAPVAAAIAGLIKAANPALTPAQIKTALTTTAVDIEGVGTDRDTGFGVVMAYPAMQSLALTGNAFLEFNGSAVTVTTDNNTNTLLDPSEEANLSVNLKNTGLQSANGITATLTTSTPNVAILSGASTYSNLAAGANGANATPFTIKLAPAAPVDLTIQFTLTINHTGGWNPSQVINFAVKAGRQTITTTLDAAAPTTSGSYPVTAVGTQTGRLNLSGAGTASTCGVAKANPGASATGARPFESYTFTNTSASTVCVTVTLQEEKQQNDFLFAVAYAGSYNPAAPATNYLADWGSSNRIFPMTMSFDVLAGQTVVIVVVGNTAGSAGGTPYTLTVNGLPEAATSPAELIEFGVE